MKILFLTADYEDFLGWLYTSHPDLAQSPFETQLEARRATFFAGPDAMASALRRLGHEAEEIYVNNLPMLHAWAEKSSSTTIKSSARRVDAAARAKGVATKFERLAPPGGFVRSIGRRLFSLSDSVNDLVAAQVDAFAPDVIVNMAMEILPVSVIQSWSRSARLIGWNSHSALEVDHSAYWLVISAVPTTVKAFRRLGIRAEHLPLAFDERVLPHVAGGERNYGVTFIGSFYSVHSPRVEWLRQICMNLDNLSIWGPGVERLSPSDPLRSVHQGTAWGIQMYNILAQSQIALNHHGSIGWANNSRLFEATGCGATLLTDQLSGIDSFFDVGSEILSYKNAGDAIGKVTALRESGGWRAIGTRGQRRTLNTHTTQARARRLLEHLDR